MTATEWFTTEAIRFPDRAAAVVKFEVGPLDGIRLSVLQREALSPSMGFCTVTDTGPVQVLYEDGGDGLRVFKTAEQVGF